MPILWYLWIGRHGDSIKISFFFLLFFVLSSPDPLANGSASFSLHRLDHIWQIRFSDFCRALQPPSCSSRSLIFIVHLQHDCPTGGIVRCSYIGPRSHQFVIAFHADRTIELIDLIWIESIIENCRMLEIKWISISCLVLPSPSLCPCLSLLRSPFTIHSSLQFFSRLKWACNLHSNVR